MGTLLLVRHGQASYFSQDYDRLSPVGEEQARRLGEHWARAGVTFDRVFTGPRRRQVGTARIVGEVMRAAGRPFPEPILLEALDEMRADEVFRRSLPEVLAQDESLRAEQAVIDSASSRERTGKALQRLFEAVVARWVRGEITHPDIEAWPEFCARVAAALARMREGAGKGARIVGFTSGGTISAAMKHALGTSDPTTLELAWVIRNSSIAEFLFTERRLTLAGFNHLPHLDEPRLLTHR